ncbi:MAG: F0F1 ATP synthase subunit A [Planctomycetes bacterium]|nr:F0F1 ATP synthase subunit A [Planctomycetota bacterium]
MDSIILPFMSGDTTDPMAWIFNHSLDHSYAGESGFLGVLGSLGITKFTLNMWLSAGILLFVMWRTDTTSKIPSGKLRGTIELLYGFIRDEIVYPMMGPKYGRTFLPFFLTLFSFILVMNFVGLMPIPGIGGAATSNINLTAALAIITFLVSLVGGIWYNGPIGFLKSFMPSGVPLLVMPILFPIEILGFVIKHAVLAIRLFANMLAGHLVLGSFLGLIFVYKNFIAVGGAIPLALFVALLEVMVAFLQAYVFTLLAVLFVGGSVHPEH